MSKRKTEKTKFNVTIRFADGRVQSGDDKVIVNVDDNPEFMRAVMPLVDPHYDLKQQRRRDYITRTERKAQILGELASLSAAEKAEPAY